MKPTIGVSGEASQTITTQMWDEGLFWDSGLRWDDNLITVTVGAPSINVVFNS